jgi:hypothetical protein
MVRRGTETANTLNAAESRRNFLHPNPASWYWRRELLAKLFE